MDNLEENPSGLGFKAPKGRIMYKWIAAESEL